MSDFGVVDSVARDAKPVDWGWLQIERARYRPGRTEIQKMDDQRCRGLWPCDRGRSQAVGSMRWTGRSSGIGRRLEPDPGNQRVKCNLVIRRYELRMPA